jgi:hypothetical protein
MTEEDDNMADETYSAKQVARRIGTDAKTFRKWLRSDASPYPAVGQGQRYEFPVKDLPRIKSFFDTWKNRSTRKVVTAPVNGHTKPITQVHTIAELQAARDEEYGTLDGEEPTPEELEALELEELED